MKNEYAVVMGNSTAGAYIVEKSNKSMRNGSIAYIAYHGGKEKCIRVSEKLNDGKCPVCDGALSGHDSPWTDCGEE